MMFKPQTLVLQRMELLLHYHLNPILGGLYIYIYIKYLKFEIS